MIQIVNLQKRKKGKLFLFDFLNNCAIVLVIVNPISIAIAGILFVVGLLVGRQTSETQFQEINSAEKQTPTPVITTIQDTPVQTPTSIPTQTTQTMPSKTPTPPPSEQQKPKDANTVQSFLYPGSVIKGQTATELQLQSNADANTITSWYEQKLISLQFQSRSIAKTSSNGNIENKLAGTKNGEKIEISIQKSSDSKTVSITVVSSFSNNSDVRIEIKNNTIGR